MLKEKLFVGIDTSNYTTSVALCRYDGQVVMNLKKMLDVEMGQRGLRQSDALFSHTKNLPEHMDILSDTVRRDYPNGEICAVGYSAYPRDVEGSYMPCFLAGRVAAHSLASGLCVPIYKFSHQAGHIKAGLYSSSCEDEIISLSKECGDRFIAFHVSGGTTEVLLVNLNGGGMSIEQIGGTKDINAGQAIDRAGVLMGMKFPCGREMESVTTSHKESIRLCVDGLYCNLSGLENKSQKLYAECGDAGEVSAYVFDFVGKTLLKISDNVRALYPDIPILYAGGVMSNKIIKSMLSKNERTYFAQPEFSSDNAAGIALLCRNEYMK